MIITQTKSFVPAFSVLPMLRTLNTYYPKFEDWYVNTVVPGLILGKDILVIAKDNNKIAGVSLGKITNEETKLRCVRVLPEYQNTGLGIKLIDKTLELLQNDKPTCSVSEELFHLYSRPFINRYGFSLSNVTKGEYRKEKLEYHFN